MKRPDLLIFHNRAMDAVDAIISELGGIVELPFTSEEDPKMRELLSHAVVAVECENSLWRASQMPDFGTPLKPQRRLGGQLGLRKNAVVPTIIVKEEDRNPLKQWQDQRGVKIHIWHVFYDMAYGVSLDYIEQLIRDGLIEETQQVFQAPGGAVSRKIIYKIYYHYAYTLGRSTTEPNLIADHITDKNGHILTYVRFEGGNLLLDQQAVQALDNLDG